MFAKSISRLFVLFVSAALTLSAVGPAAARGDSSRAPAPMFSASLGWNTFGGSSSYDLGRDIAVDSAGNSYVTGHSDAMWGAPINAYAGSADVIVAKFNSSGALVWNTFLGSSADDVGLGIAVDSAGNAYVTGYSDATWGAPINAFAGVPDAFVARLDSSGALVWNTFLGSSNYDISYGIAVNSTGNAYVTGYSDTTWGAPINAFAGNGDAFVARLDSSGAL
ncbi:MAG: SBBP repeat-containing protein, partial [Chloroflexota bacterium]